MVRHTRKDAEGETIMRKQPGSPPEITKKQIDTIITQERVYELITPLFGGGVTPGEADPVTIIRGTEIRGQLRFWWRACRGGQKKFGGDPAKMKQAENEIWGAAYKKDEPTIPQDETVQITVEVLKPGTPVEPFQIEEKDGRKQVKPNPVFGSPHPYAAFPLQPSQEEQQKEDLKLKEVRRNVSFKLTISFPVNHQTDVEAALWAWETFGGVGARTRRGFGALRCISIEEGSKSVSVKQPEANPENVRQWLQENLKLFVVDGRWPVNVPHLTQQLTENKDFKLMSAGNTHNAFAIWNALIERLRSFRQKMRYPSRKPNAKNPGRSMWPEPSAIRQHTGQSLRGHDSPIPNPPIDKFPRAAFGLPIIFQFKDRNKENPDDPQRDPRNTVLQPLSSERFASPLILKPLACKQRECVGLALILDGTKLGEEELELKTQKLKTQKGQPQNWKVKASLDPGEALRLRDQNRTIVIDSQTDALQAFLKYL
jgi:CRISPR-associated protein Cmr1